jgi:CDP-diacylglycerol--glycerol-3-phosphate 3-phosphatidyltransferase
MNLPNRLTVSRVLLTSVFVVVLSISLPYHYTIALVIFLIAALTDYADGVIARKYNLITDFGKLMDPLADKILTASAFICLVSFGAFPAWVTIVIVSREFLITGLRLLASSKGIILPAEKLGKHKTAWQMITIVYFLLLLTAKEWSGGSSPALQAAWTVGGPILVAVTVFLTAYSGLAYFWKNRRLLESM